MLVALKRNIKKRLANMTALCFQWMKFSNQTNVDFDVLRWSHMLLPKYFIPLLPLLRVFLSFHVQCLWDFVLRDAPRRCFIFHCLCLSWAPEQTVWINLCHTYHVKYQVLLRGFADSKMRTPQIVVVNLDGLALCTHCPCFYTQWYPEFTRHEHWKTSKIEFLHQLRIY